MTSPPKPREIPGHGPTSPRTGPACPFCGSPSTGNTQPTQPRFHLCDNEHGFHSYPGGRVAYQHGKYRT